MKRAAEKQLVKDQEDDGDDGVEVRLLFIILAQPTDRGPGDFGNWFQDGRRVCSS